MHVVFLPPLRKLQPLHLAGLMGVFGLLVARFVPLAQVVPFWNCGFRQFTGIPCPGCGLTRAAERLAHFNIEGALLANPLGALVGMILVLAAILSVIQIIFRVPLPRISLTLREQKIALWMAVVLFVINYAWVVYAHRWIEGV